MGEVFSISYPQIKKSAHLITRRTSRNAKELINQTYIELHEKSHPKAPDEFTKWFVKAMHLRSLPKSTFFQQTTYRTFESSTLEQTEPESPVLEYEPPFIPESLPSELVPKYISLISFKKWLPLHEQVIFELYYESNLSGHEITRNLNSEGYSINRHNVNKMINSIKTKLAEWKKKV